MSKVIRGSFLTFVIPFVLLLTFHGVVDEVSPPMSWRCGSFPPPDGRVQFDDRFDRSNLGDSYEVYDGPGAAEIKPISPRPRSGLSSAGRLWYHAGTRGVEMAHDRHLVIDELGRVYAPSLLIAHQFPGDKWVLETKISYHGFQDGTTAGGRTVNLSVAFGAAKDPTKFSVEIYRHNDNPGDPNRHGTVNVTYTSGERGASTDIPLGFSDSYYWRIQRNKRAVFLGFSNDGHKYCQISSFSFDSQIDGMEQAFLINGIATGPGADAEIQYLTIRTSDGTPAQEVKRPLVLNSKRPIAIPAMSITRAIEAGRDVDIEDAVVVGNLDLSEIGTQPLFPGIRATPMGRLTCKSCIFEGRIIAPWRVFTNDVSFVNCTMKSGVSFLGSQFRAKADFSGSRFRDVAVFNSAKFGRWGADFSGTRFEDPLTRAWFRGVDFQGPTSFYGAMFNGGADFSATYLGSNKFDQTNFENDVTFSDIAVGEKTDIVFYKAKFHRRALFYIAPHRYYLLNGNNPVTSLFLKQALVPSGSWGRELSFEGAQFLSEEPSGSFPGLSKNSGQSGLIFSTDAPGSPEERFGSSSWATATRITLRDASFGQLTISNLAFTGVVDLRGAHFIGGPDSIRLLSAEFDRLLVSEWPSTQVVATRRTRDSLVGMFDGADDPTLARIVYFDLLATSTEYDRWWHDFDQNPKKPPQSYRDYTTFLIAQSPLNVFGVTDYGTSMPKILFMGAILVLCFTGVFCILDRGRCLVRIDKPLKFSLRLADIPILSAHERALERHEEGRRTADTSAQGWLRERAGVAMCCVYDALLFSLGNITKFGGFESIRLRDTPKTPRALTIASWTAWVLGYFWIGIAIYALTAIPVLKGVVR